MSTVSSSVEQAAANARKTDAGASARAWMLEATSATLCTTSAHTPVEGFPFGSVVPYALLSDGRPVLQLASMAAHTANLRRDPRASLFIRQPGLEGDPQTGWRLTVMGRFAQITDPELLEEAFARFVERVPAATRYERVHTFGLYVMEHIEAVRYIAGFGRITWLDGAEILRVPAADDFAARARHAVEHMNEDHADSLFEMCEGFAGFRPEGAQMTALDPTGFLIRTTAPDRLVHLGFGREIGASDIRHAVIDVLKRVRSQA